jgi:ribosomal protein S18 acetylase RimI-like enzyme
MEISLRPAVKSDIPDLARLLQMAGGGLMDAVYHDLIPGRPVGEIMEGRFRNEASYSHYRYSTVAVAHGKIAGGVNLYALDDPAVHWIDPIVPETRRLVLQPFSHLKPAGGLYVDFIAVYPGFQGKGVGKLLLAFAVSEARRRGLPLLHLHVFEENGAAVRLYQSIGFDIAKSHPVTPHPMLAYGGNMVLMSCPV